MQDLKQKTFTKKLVVQSSESDSNKKLKPFSFLCNAQELANEHAERLGFGYDELIKHNCAWVLSRIKVKFLATPKWQDVYNLTTWHKGMEGLFSLRDFSATSEQDSTTPIISATTSWLIIDLTTRRIVRADHLFGEDIFQTAHLENALPSSCGKLVTPKEMEKSFSHSVRISDIDMNQHTNNAKYIEWAFDVLPFEVVKEKDVDEFQINYSKETKLGDTIDFYMSNSDNQVFWIEGRRDNELIFQTVIKFK